LSNLFCSRNLPTEKPKETDNNLVVSSDESGLFIQWNGKVRISKGMPILEHQELTTRDIETNQSTTQFNFHSKQQPVIIESEISPDNNVLVLSISTDLTTETKGEDYLGLYFQNFHAYERGIASYLFGDWESWTKPIQVKDVKDAHSNKIQFFLFQYDDGNYGAMIPLGGTGYNASLGNYKNGFGAKSVSYKDNFKAEKVPLMAISFGKDPYKTVKNLYEFAMTTMGLENGLRKNKKYPKTFESLGWCSWNALGEMVTEKNLMEAVSTFQDNGVVIPFLLIDDGWLTVNETEQLMDYGFDKKKFPKGFKASALKLKKKYGIKDIGVWHTMNGYWSGIDKESFPPSNDDMLLPYYDKADVHADSLSGMTYYTASPLSTKGRYFYDTWYRYLKNEGITFVKVDQQSIIKRIAMGQIRSDSRLPYWEVARNMQNNLQTSIKEHFDGVVINCQDMATENAYNFESSSIGRNSDDFFPERTEYYSIDVEKGNAAAHVLANLHNSLWFSNLVWPDFDMFQSHHIDAEYHAIARAISGGPIYLTDEPGKQNFEILKQLALKDGSILRTDTPALPTKDCLFHINEHKAFKAFSFVSNTGVIGVWNTVDVDSVNTTISPVDVHGIKGEKFVVYDYFSKKVSVLSREDKIKIELGRMGYGIYSVVPVENNMAAIGLINKYISFKGLKNIQISSNLMETTLAEEGIFAAFLPSEPIEVILNGQELASEEWAFSDGLFYLEIEKNQKIKNPTIKIKLDSNGEN